MVLEVPVVAEACFWGGIFQMALVSRGQTEVRGRWMMAQGDSQKKKEVESKYLSILEGRGGNLKP